MNLPVMYYIISEQEQVLLTLLLSNIMNTNKPPQYQLYGDKEGYFLPIDHQL